MSQEVGKRKNQGSKGFEKGICNRNIIAAAAIYITTVLSEHLGHLG